MNVITVHQVEPYKPDQELLHLLNFYKNNLKVVSSKIVEKGFGVVVRHKVLNFKFVNCELKQYDSPFYILHIYTNTTVGMACSDILYNSLKLGKPLVVYFKLSESRNYKAVMSRWIPRHFKIVNPITVTVDEDYTIVEIAEIEARARSFLKNTIELESKLI